MIGKKQIGPYTDFTRRGKGEIPETDEATETVSCPPIGSLSFLFLQFPSKYIKIFMIALKYHKYRRKLKVKRRRRAQKGTTECLLISRQDDTRWIQKSKMGNRSIYRTPKRDPCYWYRRGEALPPREDGWPSWREVG